MILHDAPTAPPTQLPVGPFGTVPNVITLLRTLVSVGLGVLATAHGEPVWLVVAYAVYWLGDMADGWSARLLGQETRAGAVFDVICDRACASVLCVGLVAIAPGTAPVVALFLFSFLVLDTMLSLSFLCWPILGPNYFGQVDHRVWLLNWSPAAKALNTVGVVGALALGWGQVAFVVVVVVLGIKTWSAARVARLIR